LMLLWGWLGQGTAVGGAGKVGRAGWVGRVWLAGQ